MTTDYDAEVRKISRSLAEIAHTLESSDHVPERIRKVLTLTQQLVPYSQCALLTFGLGSNPDLFVCPDVPPAEHQRVLETLTKLFRLIAEAEEIGRGSGPARHLALPVMGLDQIIGVLRVEPAESTVYDATHLRLLSVVAAQLGAYLTMIKLRQEDLQQAMELSKAHEFQQRMLAVVGHDLRNPLAVITSVAAQLLTTTQDERQAKYVTRALRNAQKASRIITDLLDVTQARVTGQMPVLKQPVSLRDLVVDVVGDAQVEHPGVAFVVKVMGSGNADCDPTRMSQLTTNLLTNALNHGDRGAPVQIELHLGDNDVVLAVRNEGPAIPGDLLPHIFDPFRRGTNHGRSRHGGLGLGLYIVDQIARAHGGAVVAASSDGAGTSFTVTFPRWDRETSHAEEADGYDPQSARSAGVPDDLEEPGQPMVLVVDDDSDIRDGMTELLKRRGLSAATAANGAEALELLRAGLRPRVVLVDLCMPVMDGEEFCAALQRDPVLSSIAVCIISGDTAKALKVSRASASAFLPKPLSMGDVLETLNRLTQ